MTRTFDFLIIGGGIIGLTIALEIRAIFPIQTIAIIEKESHFGMHASGRNSGVLHAGFYYSADSLKAQFTRDGNAKLKDYCKINNIPLNNCGKLVVAKDQSELDGLEELLNRAKKNNVILHKITENEAKEIEPRVKTYEQALFSPTTSSVNPKDVLNQLINDCRNNSIDLLTDTRYLKKTTSGILTSQGAIDCGFLINCAGLYADKIARDYGFSQNYRILPFKGLYLYSEESPGALRTNIYPVPNLGNPFLGVHFTLTHQNKIKIGPTAIPAFWREQYQKFEQFNLKELAEILFRQSGLMLHSNFDFKKLAFEEIQKYSKKNLVSLASKLLKGVENKQYKTWGNPGIRAQLLDIRNRKLEMDFVIQGDKKSLHVLNAVSPAFTCCFPFASYVVKQVSF